jgi:pimeloyl-ACP methyl ester carboxylesterase
MDTIDAGPLSIAVEQHGAAEAPAVLLLHGWPDDWTTWARVAPVLAEAGLRVVVPSLRGFAGTRFRDPAAPRTGNAAALATDAIALMDALGIARFAVVGHDWGSNITEMLAVGFPDRVERLAMLSSPPRLGPVRTPPFHHARLYWYHWFQATDRGAEAVRADPVGFARIMWETWSPPGWWDEASFAAVARSFANPDFVDVTLHSYRARWGEAEPDPSSLWLHEKLIATTTMSHPAVYVAGEADGVNPIATADAVPEKFTGPFAAHRLPGVGHFPQREAPDAVARILVPFLQGE